MKKYRHYKGAVYEFLCVATHSETDEKLVVYKNEQGEIYARPYEMFFEKVECEGKMVSRFEEIK